jgi:tRNA-dihydrouridine synthase
LHLEKERCNQLIGNPEPFTVVQLASACPNQFTQAVEKLAALGWSSFNLNCGCPSNRVQSGSLGAMLMRSPTTVAHILRQARVSIPLASFSLKCRIGIVRVSQDTLVLIHVYFLFRITMIHTNFSNLLFRELRKKIHPCILLFMQEKHGLVDSQQKRTGLFHLFVLSTYIE